MHTSKTDQHYQGDSIKKRILLVSNTEIRKRFLQIFVWSPAHMVKKDMELGKTERKDLETFVAQCYTKDFEN